MEEGDAIKSSSVVTVETYPEIEWAERLIWAPLQVVGQARDDAVGAVATTTAAATPSPSPPPVSLWWPAVRFESIVEFDRYHQHVTDKSYRTDLAVLMMNRVQLAEPIFCIEYLGRPLADVQVLEEKEFQPEYYGSLLAMVLGAMSCKPQFFADRLPQELVAITYQDFHRALDLTLPYLGQPETDTFVKSSQSSWQEWEAQQTPATAVTVADQGSSIPSGGGNGGQRSKREVDSPVRPSRASVPRADCVAVAAVAPAGAAGVAASPNHSIAAVSVTDESMVSATSHLTPASTVATTTSYSSTGRPNNSAGLPTYEGWPRSMDPLGDIPWQEAHALLRMSGWTKYVDHDNQIMYHYQAQGPALTLPSMQTLAKHRYGWKPPAAQTPSPSRQSRRRAASQPPSTNARNYSFGFVWTHKLAPEGWKKVPPKGPDAKLVDYYYLRPHVSLSQLGKYRKGLDYFDDHWVVLDWCRENDYFRTLESSASETESIASGVADDPSTYLESMEEHVDCEDDDDEEEEPNTTASLAQPKRKKTKKKKQPNKKKSKASQKNFSFGVLWAIHLEPQGWTMPRTKGNALIDYYYVRPGRSTSGVLGEDYFQSTDQVLDWCRLNNDYPQSSSPETNLKDGATSSIGDEDESTKHPAETEDDHTIGDQTEYSTPGTRTKPQDPSLPLLRDDDVDTDPLTEADRYDWKNLWPMLLKLGWKTRKSRNSLENWRFERPRRLNDESEEMILGKHYFTAPEDVIAHVKEMDRLEQGGVSNSDCEDVFDGKFLGHGNHASKSSNILSSSDEEEPVKKMVARKKGATISKKYSKGISPSDQKSQASKKRKKSKDDRPIWLKIDVDVDPLENTAPWATNPVPKTDLHHIVTKIGGIQYTGSHYYLRDDPSVRFDDITEVLKQNARLGSGNYAIAADAEPDEKALFLRLVDYAFCPGSDFDRRQTRRLNQVEIEDCLREIFSFEKKADGCWYDCLGSARTKSSSQEKTLKSSYDSLPQLLRDLRGIENLEGTSNVRKRTPLGKEGEEFKKKKRLIMAFRLSIADDAVVDNLNGTLSQAFHPNPPRKKRATGTKSIASSKAAPTKSSGEKSRSDSSIDELDFEKECEKEEHDGGKLGSKRSLPTLCKSESAKKRDMKEAEAQRMENCIKENTFKVFNDSAQPHDAIVALAENPDRKWTLAKQLGAIYQGVYHLPDRYGMDYSNNPMRECTSTDELFRHLGTYGGYDLKDVEEMHREEAKLEIACANVPGRRSEWKKYRMIEEHEGVRLLNMLGFERPTRGCPEWIVPDRLLAYKNRYVEGNPPLLKKKYANTDDLRLALRRIPDLQYNPEETRRRASPLTQDIMIVLRLWIASGPVGPDYVSYSAQAPETELPSEASTMVQDNTGPSSLPSSPGSQSLATQDQEGLPSPTRREDLFTQPEESENDDVGLQEAIAGFVNATPDKPGLRVEFESPNHGLLTQAPADED